jgi:lipoprotein-releasing system permease protein
VLIHGGGNHLVSVYGIEPDLESRVSIIPGHLVDGRLSRLEPGTNKVFMGRSLAYQLGVREGDLMTLIIPEPSAGGNSVTPRMARVEVAGFFEVDSEVDYSLMLMDRKDLAAIARDTSLTWRVTVGNIFLAPAVAQDIRALGGSVLSVEVWTDEYGDFFETVRMEKIMMFILLTLIVAIAAFNIVSGLSMMVKEKQADIAVLRTLGLAPSRVMQVFVIQGTLVGVLGTIGGMLIGVPLAVYIPEVIGFFEDLVGARMLAGTYFDRVPSDVRPADLVVIVLVSLGLSLAATLYPAWRAAQLHPADVLRYE